MLKNGRLTAHWSNTAEREQEASRQIHLAMYRFTLGQITEKERQQLLAILRPCCPDLFASTIPPPRREWELPIVEEQPGEGHAHI
jgi:hypothetical protein